MTASVSVIIPTYNRAEVLDRAIVSAVTQRIDGMEILVVDDGSTDATSAAFGLSASRSGPSAYRSFSSPEHSWAWSWRSRPSNS